MLDNIRAGKYIDIGRIVLKYGREKAVRILMTKYNMLQEEAEYQVDKYLNV